MESEWTRVVYGDDENDDGGSNDYMMMMMMTMMMVEATMMMMMTMMMMTMKGRWSAANSTASLSAPLADDVVTCAQRD